MRYTLFITFLLALLFSCKNKSDNNSKPNRQISIAENSVKADSILSVNIDGSLRFSSENYDFTIEIMDSTNFKSVYDIYYTEKKPPVKITSLSTVEKILKECITVDTTTIHTFDISEIKDRKGNILSSKNDFKEEFKAYYPVEDVILLGGGHDSEMTFDLTTGEKTENIGCPEESSLSPNKKYEITGWYGGQECISYIIRESTGGKFRKIADFKHEDLCYFVDCFWIDDSTFCYSIKYQNETMKYYQLLIKKR